MPNTALITGASSGIGWELAKYHASKGGDLIITARREDKLNNLKAEIEKNYDVNVEYLEARREKDLSITNSIKKSRIFVAYYLDKVRLIDNF